LDAPTTRSGAGLRVIPYLWVPALFIAVGLLADFLQLVGAAFAYVIAVLVCLTLRSPLLPLIVAATATPAAASSYFLSHALGVRPIFVVAVRIAMVWITALLVSRELRQAAARERTQDDLRDARRLAAEKLSEIETLYGIAPVGMMVLDRRLRCIRMNEKMAQLMGVRAEAALGRQLRDFLPAELAGLLEPTARHVFESGQGVENVEAAVGTGTGSSQWLLGFHPWTSSGEVHGVQAIVQDVTERRHIEQARSQIKSTLDLALQAGRAGTFDWDIRNDVNLWSDQLLELYGIRPEEFGQKRADWGAAVLAEDRAQALAALERSLRSGRFEAEFRIVRRDTGELRWMHGAGQVFFEDESPVRMVGINVDITEQKRIEAALATRTEELRRTFDATPTGLARCSRDLRYLSANTGYARIIGIPVEGIVGYGIADVLGTEAFEAMRPHIGAVLGGQSVEYESSIVSRSSGPRLLQTAFTPWREPDGTVSGWIASVTDVTARQAAEEKLRTANRQKDEFLAMMAHELRNPLAPIRNVAELLGRRLESQPDAAPLLAILHRQSDQLTRLVDDLLDVSRISQGRINLRMQSIDIAVVLDQAVETIRPLVAEKSHQLRIRKPLFPVYVNGDTARLVQSLGNVLHNAAKYTDAGGEIDVDIQQSAGEVRIAVRDSGTGIAPDLLPNVFDLFVQSPRTLDRSEGGLGIGLTVVKQLVQMHGGTVLAQSEGQGRGSTFTLCLPSAPPPGPATTREVRVKAAPRRILVVDDNRDAADSLAIILRLEGHEVSTAYGARAALDVAQKLTPEVVLLDIGLPVMDGYEVARRLLARADGPAPRVIALTGYGQSEDRTRALAAGFAGYLTKPVDHDVLNQMIADEPRERRA